jgi:hypothetical protein
MKSPGNMSAEWIALLICMLHVRDSDLGLETVFPEDLLVFSVTAVKCRDDSSD